MGAGAKLSDSQRVGQVERGEVSRDLQDSGGSQRREREEFGRKRAHSEVREGKIFLKLFDKIINLNSRFEIYFNNLSKSMTCNRRLNSPTKKN